ncbi:hypothetical protein BGP77_11250 [Saccharospirillum sp. MSK14-1]|uniref:hypothetical protein n=1 Tax=Saccharospirillum sp. MSK14-1 TaxID=1897632 RepID=UPI000D35B6FF|nr:hypothetical protein [Saccharospirillum sp. MSK14-1]PTY38748.1 hypothetical protein BGP77_11250 [Saccharospirillum sp. MSK14-1]
MEPKNTPNGGNDNHSQQPADPVQTAINTGQNTATSAEQPEKRGNAASRFASEMADAAKSEVSRSINRQVNSTKRGIKRQITSFIRGLFR